MFYSKNIANIVIDVIGYITSFRIAIALVEKQANLEFCTNQQRSLAVQAER